MDKETFVGPCSKFVDGQGWTTEIPVQMLKEKGYVKVDELQKAEIENLHTLIDLQDVTVKKILENNKVIEKYRLR